MRLNAEEVPEEEPSLPRLFSWVDELHRVSVAVDKKPRRLVARAKQIFYFLHASPDGRDFGVTIHKGHSPETATPWWKIDFAELKSPAFVDVDDLAIFRLLREEPAHTMSFRAFGLSKQHGAKLLAQLAESRRLYFANDFSELQLGESRSAALCWQLRAEAQNGIERIEGIKGLRRPYFEITPEITYQIPVEPPWYVDLYRGLIGALEAKKEASPPSSPSPSSALFSTLFALTSENYVQFRHNALLTLIPELFSLAGQRDRQIRRIDSAAQPVLRFQSFAIDAPDNELDDLTQQPNPQNIDLAVLSFRYQGLDLFSFDRGEFLTLNDNEIVQVLRRPEEEKNWIDALLATGLEKIPGETLLPLGLPRHAFGFSSESAWEAFVQNTLPRLRKAGWIIEIDADFRHYSLRVDSWLADLSDADAGWLNLDLAIMVDGKRLALAPLLASLFCTDARWLDSARFAHIPDHELIEFRTPDQQRLCIEAEKLKPLAALFLDLFDGFSGGTTLRLSRFDAARINELNNLKRWIFHGESELISLAERLAAAQGIQTATPPAGLAIPLRSYQREGLAWLQFLREQNISGILADDMGLGKTAQVLAHILLEKEAGRLDRPVLIVLPTSLVFNWENEIARFTPALTRLSLHGADRKPRFAAIPDHDIIVTTYSLIWRDAEDLLRHAFHILILDEAQVVKNPRSRSADIVRKINTRHKLCLTGTPLENHLGELWSQFDFLLPGFLGTRQAFKRIWREPIEKQQDQHRRELLARRIQPFILRRKKETVMRELPPKTIIIQRIDLSENQRALYETVRVAMSTEVRNAVADRGLGGSQMIILDALLKLRQVCCDPRLLKFKHAQNVKERAKLDLLMSMLIEQAAEGRRVLVFSQFTQMLALIEDELKANGLNYVLLTGSTKDRQTPVRRFQTGEIPIFLISLKAGGVGLNLTAADTVIHYDPWWNPAVENQATDRAHRIGQEKSVFVYKLIVANSIEEKILALQERKASLAEGILSEDHGVNVKFTSDDIAALFNQA